MDDLNCQGEMLKQTLHELKVINKLLGGNHVTTGALQKLLTKNTPYHIADMGCGGGDMAVVMANWANKNSFNIKITGIDANPNIIDYAQRNTQAYSNIDYLVANVFDPTLKEHQFDIVTCTLFTHHFTDDELVNMLQNFQLIAGKAIIINDLHRHPLAWHSIKWLTRFFSKSPMVQNDAPLSVARSFKRADWEKILSLAGIAKYSLRWFWAFRWQLIIYK